MKRTINRRTWSRKIHPPAIEVIEGDVVRPGNSGSTLGTPPGKDQIGTSAADAIICIARNGFVERTADHAPFMFYNPGNMCYRNTVLALLLNTDPFLGWLRSNGWYQTDPNHSIVSLLYAVAEAYWLPESNSKTALMMVRMNLFWQQFNRTWMRPSSQEDVAEFLGHLFRQMYENQAPECLALSDLFLTLKAPRIIAGQACDHVKVHTDLLDKDRIWPLHRVWVASDSATTLVRRIQASLHEREPDDICPICCEEIAAGHRFSKLAKLPEVLLVEILRGVSSPTTRTLEERESAARVHIPETIDLDELVLDESTYKGDATFDIIGAVSHLHKGRHFIAHIRNKVGDWFKLDDQLNPRVTRSSLARLNTQPSYNVVLVSYVRRRKAGAREHNLAGCQHTSTQPTILQPTSPQATDPQHSAETKATNPVPDESLPKPPEVSGSEDASNQEKPEEARESRAESMPGGQEGGEMSDSVDYDDLSDVELRMMYSDRGFSLLHYANKSRLYHISELVEDDAGRIPYERKKVAWLKAELERRGHDSKAHRNKGALVKALQALDTRMLIDEPLEEKEEEQEAGTHGALSTTQGPGGNGDKNGNSGSSKGTAEQAASIEPDNPSSPKPRTPSPVPQPQSEGVATQATTTPHHIEFTRLLRGPRAQSEPLPRIPRPHAESTARVTKYTSVSPTVRPSRPFQRGGSSARIPITRQSPRRRPPRPTNSIPVRLVRTAWRGLRNLPRSIRRLCRGTRGKRRPAVARDWVGLVQEWMESGRCAVQ